MKGLRKNLVIAGLATLLTISIGAVATFGSQNHVHETGADAATCKHEGNHYDCLEATASTSGIKEYWVCCKCHEHYLSKPTSGTWTNAGVASITINSNDNRYMAPGHLSNGIVLSADGKSITSYTPVSGVTTVVIPEGVETIPANVFNGSDIKTVSFPSTLTEIADGAFKDCRDLTTVVINNPTTEVGDHAFYVTGTQNWGDLPSELDIFVNFTSSQESTMIKKGQLASDWKERYTSSPIGAGLIFKTTTKATVYYSGEWHLDANGNPVKDKSK